MSRFQVDHYPLFDEPWWVIDTHNVDDEGISPAWSLATEDEARELAGEMNAVHRAEELDALNEGN